MSRLATSSLVLVALTSCSTETVRARRAGPLAAGPRLGLAVAARPVGDVSGAAERFASRERSTGPSEDLGSLVEVRLLPVPEVRRGGAAPFSVGDGHSGWVASLPEGQLVLTPAFADGKVLVGGGFASHTVYALDARTGAFRWQAAASDGGPSAAIIDDGRAFYNTESCTIFAVDVETGRPLWSQYLGDPMMAQPAAADGRVFTAHKNQEGQGHMLTALSARDGRILWQVALGADIITAPTLSEGRLFFATMNGVVARLDPRTGRRLWQKGLRAVSAPWVDGDRLYLSRRVAAPAGERGPFEQQVIVSAADGRTVSEGAPVAAPHLRGAGRVREILQQQAGAWENDATRPGARHLGIRSVADGWAYQGARPTVIDGRSYAAVGDAIECRDIESGRLLWRRRYAEDRGAQAMSPPAVVGSQMIVATIDGQVHAIDIDSGASLWAWDVGEPIAYQPSVARGWVYVGTATGKVIAFQAADESLDGWHMWGGNATHDGLVDAPASTSAPPGEPDFRPGEGVLRVVPPGRDEPTGLPLQHTGVEVQVSGFVASVSVAQTFQNPHAEPLEAIYHFPLPTNAAVDAMLVRVGDRRILGRIERRQRARVLYRAARDAGALAALLEEQRPDLFTQRVANVPAGGAVTVELHYVQLLPYDQGAYELRFPMVTERRAADPTAGDADPAQDLSTLEGAGFRRPESVDIGVSLDAGVPIDDLESPSHLVRIDSRDERHARVELDDDPGKSPTGDAGPVASRDFLLRWRVAGETPRAAVVSHADARGGFFTMMIQPARGDAPAPIARRRVTLAIDTSSSMHGRPMEHARTVAETVLESLRDGDSFQIVSFSDLVRRHPDSPAATTDAAVIAAERWLADLRALGTTSLRGGLEAILDLPPVPDDVLDLVVLITDGYVGGDRELLREVSARLGDRRLVVLGVGTTVNRFLLERLAEVGRGALRVIAPTEDPEVVAQSVVERIDRPQLTDLEIDWGGLTVHSVYPRRLPDLYAGQPILISGRFDVAGEERVQIRGRMAGRDWTDEEIVVLDAFEEGNDAMAPVWAKARVTDLMNALWIQDDPDAEEEVTRMGLEFGLVTRFTSLLAIEDGFERAMREGGGSEGDREVRRSTAGTNATPTADLHTGALGIRGIGFGGSRFDAPLMEASLMPGDMAMPMRMAAARPTASAPPPMSPAPGAPEVQQHAEPMNGTEEDRTHRTESPEVVERQVRAHLGASVRMCHDANPALRGRLAVQIALGPDGRVTSASIADSSVHDAQLEQCIMTRARSLVFSVTGSGAPVVMRIPFLLEPTAADDRRR